MLRMASALRNTAAIKMKNLAITNLTPTKTDEIRTDRKVQF